MDNSLEKKVDVTSELYVNHGDLGGGFKPFFDFYPLPGEMIQID